jgi:hypothetical protein
MVVSGTLGRRRAGGESRVWGRAGGAEGIRWGVGWWEGVFIKTALSLLCIETKFSSRGCVQNKSTCLLGDPDVMD